ncbi:BSD domain-containing protein 1 [Tieghemiomyces parasiticus]|uniref:BSD domain-containing protein 1 n=1 Tax=Tieghemiomyces parasiticus TaxID=78921 RepID=A0A9W8AEW4_9FUNG|nr:BSD domain-containing protein 1 [Tieghemiomyces parasiticus]
MPSLQSTFAGLFGNLNRNVLKTQLQKTESTVSRWGAGLSSFIQQAITIEEPETSSHCVGHQPLHAAGAPSLHQRRQRRLGGLQASRATYLDDPAADSAYQAFTVAYQPDDHTAEVERLLESTPAVKKLYDELVPTSLTAEEFWRRYFFRVAELEERERVRERLISGKDSHSAGRGSSADLARSSSTTALTATACPTSARPSNEGNQGFAAVAEVEEEELGWDSDDSDEAVRKVDAKSAVNEKAVTPVDAKAKAETGATRAGTSAATSPSLKSVTSISSPERPDPVQVRPHNSRAALIANSAAPSTGTTEMPAVSTASKSGKEKAPASEEDEDDDWGNWE